MYTIKDKSPGNKIVEEIITRGRVTFARYMDLALYHPTEGYYMRDAGVIGAAGDFYTSTDVSPLFGKALASQMEEMWRLSGRPDPWTLLELGAGKGLLARDIMTHTAVEYHDFHRALGYRIIEKSPAMVFRQKESLSGVIPPGGGIDWLEDLENLGQEQVRGCFFSNELLDAFPVHRVFKDRGRFREIYVAYKEGGLREVPGDLSEKEIRDYVKQLPRDLEDGQAIEINLAMRGWLKKAARALEKGFILTIDYGDTARGLHSPGRPGGTIRSYRKHRLAESLYECPGDQDITAHVNFSDLSRWGEEAGLQPAGYTSQTYFLMNLGIMDYLKSPAEEGFDPGLMKETLAVKKLIMPEGMGTVFKVSAQCKGFAGRPELTGFRGRYGSRA
ncbi:MAG: class I SAM-dependent methyltransferase [Desulfocucumaceae bacterium]